MRESGQGLLETFEVETAPKPEACVIWLHGLGADGYDFEPIVPALELPDAPGVRFVFPHAPMRPVTLNTGMVMRAWYDVFSAQEVPRREDEAGIHAAQAGIEALIAREKERGIRASALVLAGFSQGGAVAIQTGLRHAERLAGILALSTYLPLAATLAVEASAANRDVPIFMAHGVADPLITLSRAARSRDLLRAASYHVAWHEYRMAHEVCDAEVRDLSKWLRTVLAAVW